MRGARAILAPPFSPEDASDSSASEAGLGGDSARSQQDL